jgi:hypothetical protein
MNHEELKRIVDETNERIRQGEKEKAAPILVGLTDIGAMGKAENGYTESLPLITVGIGYENDPFLKSHGIEYHIVAKKVDMPKEYQTDSPKTKA